VTQPYLLDVTSLLAALAHALGIDSVDLDELVHDLAAAMAADINNGGLEAQF
jgi:hypothetical protein